MPTLFVLAKPFLLRKEMKRVSLDLGKVLIAEERNLLYLLAVLCSYFINLGAKTLKTIQNEVKKTSPRQLRCISYIFGVQSHCK